MRTSWRLAVTCFLVLGGASTATADLPPLISRDILFGNPERTSPRLSPDGKYLAYIAPDDKNVLQVWLRTIGKKDDTKLTDDKKRGIRIFFWTYNPDQLLYLQDTDGDENFHLHSVNIKTKEEKDLTPHKGVRVQGVYLERESPKEVLLGMNLKDKSKFDVYRMDLSSGKKELDTENPGNIVGWTPDSQFKIRAATAAAKDGGFDLLVREAPGKDWKKLRHWGPEEEGGALSFSKDGKTLYLLGNHDANTSRLLAHDLGTGKETVVAEDPDYDLGGVLTHPTKRTIQAVSFDRDKVSWKVLDDSIAADFEALGKLHKGDFSVASRDLADKTWLVAYTVDNGPVYYYTYNREKKTGELLFSHQPKLEGLALATMKPISYKARDGLTIHGYLTLPVGIKGKNLPMVLFVHGGPWGRDSWRYDAHAQWLANRGYAVLQVNFRGSAGYGKKFLNAGNREWGHKMQDDLTDAVQWAIKEGIANPKKVAIMGGSYGGYATLAGLTFTPDLYACGVDIVGPSNIITLLKTVPPYWAPLLPLFHKRVGDPDKEEDFLKKCSPLFHVDKIKAPLLIGQGKNDPRVKQAESDQIVEAMRKAKLPVEYIIYTDEGHGFARPENRLHFYARAEAFLAKHLGGRAEPVGDIKGHSGVEK
jgi:dipeptidyl aminopeptidase/acylaminoacyl peptidase